MASTRQIAANRRNALTSTGPRTERGKAIVGRNALGHGLTARQILVPGESEDELEGLVQRLIAELQPQGELEQQLVERVAACLWRQRRIYRIESEILRSEYLEAEIWRLRELAELHAGDGASDDDPLAKRHRLQVEHARSGLSLGDAFRRGNLQTDTLTKLSRYEAGIERSLYKAHHELLRLQAQRRGETGTVPLALDIQLGASH